MSPLQKLLADAYNLRNAKGNLNGALEKVNEVLTEDSNNLEALIFKSILLRDKGEIAEAEKVLTDTLKMLKPDDYSKLADIARLQGFIYLLQGRAKEALTKAKQALKLADKANDKAMQANALALLGNIYHTENNLTKAEKYYNEACARAKAAGFIEREITVTINLATIYSLKKDWHKGLEMLNDVLVRSEGKWTKAPFNALYEKIKICREHNLMDDNLLKQVKKAQAQAASQGWADEQGNLANQLGLLYDELGQKEQAKGFLQQALEVFTSASLPKKIQLINKELAERNMLNN